MNFFDRLNVLIHYTGLEIGEVETGLLNHFVDNSDIKEESAKTKVKRILSGKAGTPNENNRKYIASFFKVISDKKGLQYNSNWLTDMECAFEEIRDLKKSIHTCMPDSLFSVFHFYRNYTKLEESLRLYVDSICRDYCIYRFHSKGKLVCDVLRIDEYENGTAKCRVYMYSDEKNYKYTIFHGNIFIKKEVALYLIASAESRHDVVSPKFIFFTFDGGDENENDGVISGIADDSKIPVSSCVLLTTLCERELNPEQDVRKINDDDDRVERTEKYTKLISHVDPILNCNGANKPIYLKKNSEL